MSSIQPPTISLASIKPSRELQGINPLDNNLHTEVVALKNNWVIINDLARSIICLNEIIYNRFECFTQQLSLLNPQQTLHKLEREALAKQVLSIHKIIEIRDESIGLIKDFQEKLQDFINRGQKSLNNAPSTNLNDLNIPEVSELYLSVIRTIKEYIPIAISQNSSLQNFIFLINQRNGEITSHAPLTPEALAVIQNSLGENTEAITPQNGWESFMLTVQVPTCPTLENELTEENWFDQYNQFLEHVNGVSKKLIGSLCEKGSIRGIYRRVGCLEKSLKREEEKALSTTVFSNSDSSLADETLTKISQFTTSLSTLLANTKDVDAKLRLTSAIDQLRMESSFIDTSNSYLNDRITKLNKAIKELTGQVSTADMTLDAARSAASSAAAVVGKGLGGIVSGLISWSPFTRGRFVPQSD